MFDLTNYASIFAGNFESREAAEDFMRIEEADDERKPVKFMNALFLKGKYDGKIEIAFFDKKTNSSEELFQSLSYGERIVEGLHDRFYDKLKRKVNTAIVMYDFYLPGHFTGHNLSSMKESRTDQYHIFYIDSMLYKLTEEQKETLEKGFY